MQTSQQSFALERRRKITFQVLIREWKSEERKRERARDRERVRVRESEKTEREFSLRERVEYGYRLLYIA